MSSKLVPYIFFYGRCAEALEFYKGVFGGSYEAMRVSDSPMASEMPPEAANSIMHSSFTADGVAFMASDGRQRQAGRPRRRQRLDGARVRRRRDAASAYSMRSPRAARCGSRSSTAFWGGRFGMLTDKFGTEWMVTLP